MTPCVSSCPTCHGPVPLREPHKPARQAIYCSTKCKNTASKRRQRGRRPSVLDQFTDEQLVRIPQRELEPYGIVF